MFGHDVFGMPILLRKSEMYYDDGGNLQYYGDGDDLNPCYKYCIDTYPESSQSPFQLCWQKCEENPDHYKEAQKANEMSDQSWVPSTEDSKSHPSTDGDTKSKKTSTKDEETDNQEPEEGKTTLYRLMLPLAAVLVMGSMFYLEQKDGYLSKMMSKV